MAVVFGTFIYTPFDTMDVQSFTTFLLLYFVGFYLHGAQCVSGATYNETRSNRPRNVSSNASRTVRKVQDKKVKSDQPSYAPSPPPSAPPSPPPSRSPTLPPTRQPSIPSAFPTGIVTTKPSVQPSSSEPTESPSTSVTSFPSDYPSDAPSLLPSDSPTSKPTQIPSFVPTLTPSAVPSVVPSLDPTAVIRGVVELVQFSLELVSPTPVNGDDVSATMTTYLQNAVSFSNLKYIELTYSSDGRRLDGGDSASIEHVFVLDGTAHFDGESPSEIVFTKEEKNALSNATGIQEALRANEGIPDTVHLTAISAGQKYIFGGQPEVSGGSKDGTVQESPSTKSDDVNLSVVVGSAVAGAFALVVVLFVYIRYKRANLRRQAEKEANDVAVTEVGTPTSENHHQLVDPE